MILDCPRCQHRFPVPASVSAEDVRCPQCGTPCPLAAVPAVACAAPLSPNLPLPATESASREDFGLLSTAAFSLPHAAGGAANGLEEAFEVIVHGQVHRYPTNCGAPVYAEGRSPAIGWYDFVLPKAGFWKAASPTT